MKFARFRRFIKKLGPGLITGASDDDPSGIATYTAAGARFGLETLWTALYIYPLVNGIQEMCARVGLVTGKGLAGNLKQHYPRFILYLTLFTVTPSIVVNIGADLQAMGAVANLIFPKVQNWVFSVSFTLVLLVSMVYFSYQRFARILKYMCLSLLLYFIVPFLSKLDYRSILQHTFIPTFRFDLEFIEILVALLGTTISPYLFFWQASMEVEEIEHRKTQVVVDKRIIHNMQDDVGFGMMLTNLTFYFIILTAGTVLFSAGIHSVDTVDQAAQALRPLAGEASYLLFAAGIIGTGLLAIPVLSGALSYIFSETFGWARGFDKTFSEARAFYIIIGASLVVGLLMENFGISPMKALLYTAILNGLSAPVLIAVILHMCNNEKIMGKNTNTRKNNLTGWITLLLMTAAGAALLLMWN